MTTTAPTAATGRPVAISAEQARHLAITAHFHTEDPTSAGVLRRLGLLQLDALRRVDRAHRLTCLARMGAEATVDQVDDQLWSPGPARAFETWVHAACLVPAEDWPLLRLARERAKHRSKQPTDAAYAEVLAIVGDSAHGVTITDIEDPSGQRTAGWDWSARKRATEFLLWRGELICSERRGNRRVYDLPERRLPATLLNTFLSREAILETITRRVLSVLGIATTRDIATYYNLTPADAAEGLTRCGASPVSVEGWPEPAWIPKDTPPQRSTSTTARLIGPFDNLIFDRDRTRRIHHFDCTFEAYKPAHTRTYGHYVMAVLHPDGHFAGRVDLQRHNGQLQAIRSFPEPTITRAQLAPILTDAVRVLVGQLGLG